MKKSFSVFGLLFFGAFLFFASSSLQAQEILSKNITLERSFFDTSEFEKLADAILKLVDVISPEENIPSKTDTKTMVKPLAINQSFCVPDLNSPSSLKKKENMDWNLDFAKNMDDPIWIDVNGDGLIDYVYHVATLHHYSTYLDAEGNEFSEMYYGSSCVVLNNGRGWNVVYKCFVDLEQVGVDLYQVVYYGDCADTSK